MSALLFSENPLVVNVGLAKAIGLNEAIVIQQIHYWLGKSRHFHDGYPWVYNSISGWKEQFPFWSDRTIRRALKELEEGGYILCGNYNRDRRDKTKWYTINYQALEVAGISEASNASGQNGHMEADKVATSIRTNWPHESGQNGQSITRDYTETTSEITAETTKTPASEALADAPDAVTEIFDHWREKMNHPRAALDPKRKRLIKAALKNYDVKDLKLAIDGCSVTPHNIGMNDRGQRYDGLHIILRDADQIDRFIQNAYNPPRIQGKRAMIEAINSQARRDFLEGDDPFSDGHTIDGEVVGNG